MAARSAIACEESSRVSDAHAGAFSPQMPAWDWPISSPRHPRDSKRLLGRPRVSEASALGSFPGRPQHQELRQGVVRTRRLRAQSYQCDGLLTGFFLEGTCVGN